MSVYKKNYDIHKHDIKNVMKAINKYNDKYKDHNINFEIEPSLHYVYVTSNDKVNINKFTDFYNKLKLKNKLYSTSEEFQRIHRSIWSPEVKDGSFIKIY